MKLTRKLPCQPPRSCLQAPKQCGGTDPADGLASQQLQGRVGLRCHVNCSEYALACLHVKPRPVTAELAGRACAGPVCRNPTHLVSWCVEPIMQLARPPQSYGALQQGRHCTWHIQALQVRQCMSIQGTRGSPGRPADPSGSHGA